LVFEKNDSFEANLLVSLPLLFSGHTHDMIGASGNGGIGKLERKAEAETEKLKLGNGRQHFLR
jgi:hypothetical protein